MFSLFSLSLSLPLYFHSILCACAIVIVCIVFIIPAHAAFLGYCFNGECPSLDRQCEKVWGYGGVAADQQCYDQFNTKGSINGHCGKDTNSDYKKCELEYVYRRVDSKKCDTLFPLRLSLCPNAYIPFIYRFLSLSTKFLFRNVKCGSLQCKDGDRQPQQINGVDIMNSKTIISIKGIEYECR